MYLINFFMNLALDGRRDTAFKVPRRKVRNLANLHNSLRLKCKFPPPPILKADFYRRSCFLSLLF